MIAAAFFFNLSRHAFRARRNQRLRRGVIVPLWKCEAMRSSHHHHHCNKEKPVCHSDLTPGATLLRELLPRAAVIMRLVASHYLFMEGCQSVSSHDLRWDLRYTRRL